MASWNIFQPGQLPPGGGAATGMWLMQDGSVLAHINGTQLWVLSPNSSSPFYAAGAWSPAGNFLIAKWDYASAVLSSGKLITCGGEWTPGPTGGPPLKAELGFCEIYDPVTSLSKQFSPPPGWTNIGDAPSAVLNDGTVLLGNTQGQGGMTQVALLHSSGNISDVPGQGLTWTFGGIDAGNNEQTYTLMQTGNVLTTHVYKTESMRYDPSVSAFVSDAPLPVMLGANSETGPAITLMNGDVVCFGATGHVCVYTPGGPGRNGTWAQVQDLPNQLIAADTPAILEPNGKVLLAASTGAGGSVTFCEFDPNTGVTTADVAAPVPTNEEPCRMLLLPNGNGLVSTGDGNWWEVVFTAGSDPSWAPKITRFSIVDDPTDPTTSIIAANSTVTLAGTQLCGLSECASYGDDNQQAENYPVVRFTDSNGAVHYVRAHDVNTRSIAPGQLGTVLVDIPSLAVGTYSVEVVAMGIPSAPFPVNVVAAVPIAISRVDPSTISTLGGTSIQLTGAGFFLTNVIDHLLVNGKPLPVDQLYIFDDTQMWMSAPPAASIGLPPEGGQTKITVKTRQGDQASVPFTYAYLPGVVSIEVNPPVIFSGGVASGTVALNEPASPDAGPNGAPVILDLSGSTPVGLGLSGSTGITLPQSNINIPANQTTNAPGGFPIVTSVTATAGPVTIGASGPDFNMAAAFTTVEISTDEIFFLLTSSTPAPPPQLALASGQPVAVTIYLRTPVPGTNISLTPTLDNVVAVPPIPPTLPVTSANFTTTLTVKGGPVGGGKVTITAQYGGQSAQMVLNVARPLQHPPPIGPNPV